MQLAEAQALHDYLRIAPAHCALADGHRLLRTPRTFVRLMGKGRHVIRSNSGSVVACTIAPNTVSFNASLFTVLTVSRTPEHRHLYWYDAHF